MAWRRHIWMGLRLLALCSPPWRRSWPWRLARLLVGILYLYGGIILVLLALEDHFVFHPARAADVWWPAPEGLTVQDVDLTGNEGQRLHAWWSAPAGWKAADGALLYCHGNAGNLSHRGPTVKHLQGLLHVAVLVFDYPGYGRSEGEPTELGCYAAGDAAYRWLTEVQKVPEGRVLLYGRSLGGSIAIEMALRHPHRALVLVSPFSSLGEMAAAIFPLLPGRWLASRRFDNLSKIGRCPRPILIAHGTADRTIPFSQGQRLFAAAPEPRVFVEMPGLDHNDPVPPAFDRALEAFLAQEAPLEK